MPDPNSSPNEDDVELVDGPQDDDPQFEMSEDEAESAGFEDVDGYLRHSMEKDD
ncbi:MAG: hypothetical protein ACLQVD_18055 [Capsulimonadaceae bacterium]